MASMDGIRGAFLELCRFGLRGGELLASGGGLLLFLAEMDDRSMFLGKLKLEVVGGCGSLRSGTGGSS